MTTLAILTRAAELPTSLILADLAVIWTLISVALAAMLGGAIGRQPTVTFPTHDNEAGAASPDTAPTSFPNGG